MNILFLNSSASFGGTEKWAINAARELQKHGHRVFFGYRFPTMRDAAHAAGLRAIRFALLNDADLFSILQIVKLIRNEHIHILISTKVKEYWLGTLAAKIGGCKSLIRLGIDRPVVNKWKNRKIFGQWADAIVVNAQSIVRSLLSASFIPERKICLIYNGVQIPEKIPAFEDDPSPFIFGYAGNLIPRKNIDILLQSFRELSILHPGRELRLWIIGAGNERTRLVDLATKLEVSRLVKFWGHRRDVPQLLTQMNAFVLVSANEGFPNAALEAMAAGVPLILSRVAGATEIITDKQNGLLVEPNKEKVTAAMDEILTNSDLRKKLRKNAREKVERNFTLEQMIRALQNLLLGVWNG